MPEIPKRPTPYYEDIPLPNFRKFPDLIPVVGLVTWFERNRRARGESVMDAYIKPAIDYRTYLGFGVSGWPEPINEQAAKRKLLLSIKFSAMPVYQGSLIIALGFAKILAT